MDSFSKGSDRSLIKALWKFHTSNVIYSSKHPLNIPRWFIISLLVNLISLNFEYVCSWESDCGESVNQGCVRSL